MGGGGVVGLGVEGWAEVGWKDGSEGLKVRGGGLDGAESD